MALRGLLRQASIPFTVISDQERTLSVCRDIGHSIARDKMPTDRSQQNLDSTSPGSAAQAAPTTASGAPSHGDASALQSEQQGTGHQTVADKLRPDSHAAKAQVTKHASLQQNMRLW